MKRILRCLPFIALLAGCAMNQQHQPLAAPHAYTFGYTDASARSVGVAGSFNDWRPQATPMRRTDDGSWSVSVELPSGTYQYLFVIDGSAWVADPAAARTLDDGFGRRNSLLVIE